ncbi:branched-chain amino acid ABC transporter, permease protein [Aeropyrum pernix]|uniref:Branched-chain amino acid ABC transporter, permease protein n=1 Tax=Aeropyrum pernix TaxID=56636 RepID=A0A401H9H8_AERPX|nr:branched-chain amino acid ABC transporter permease [Aeropyrum pernix]GBF08989.1 branched-chain amino acid ABC transporter, permease protein [Aeropyrum pernix]
MPSVDITFLVEFIVAYVAVYYVLTASLNLKAGVTGIPDFGQAMFFAVGGIVVGNLAARIAAALAGMDPSLVIAENTTTLELLNSEFFPNRPLESIAILVVAIASALALGGLLGLLASYPALRLRGDYLAIMLLVTAEALRIYTTYSVWLMGSTPTVGLSLPSLLAWTGDPGLASILLTLAIAVAVYIYMERLYNSPAGRLMRAVRDDEDASKALGKDVAKVRRNAMVVGSALAALAGVLYSINPLLAGSSVAAVSIFDRMLWTFWPWALMILGGMSSNRGVAIASVVTGAAILGPIRLYKAELARLLRVDALGFDTDKFAAGLEFILIGALILAILFLRPQGIIPEPPSRTLPEKDIEEIRSKTAGQTGSEALQDEEEAQASDTEAR